MNYFDTLYRALIDYRKNTLDNGECKNLRSAVITADPENDRIEVMRKNCIVEEDWIDAIERGLEFVEKAIKEERQFIRSNGEVIPIEKVKRVSKDSVEHLARHSNYFTREPEEGQDLIPDQLYTVERLSDYAVYENRFLYMLLCYLRDFIAIRYERIVELTNTYNGNMTMQKDVVEGNRRLKIEIKLEEEKKNDEYLREHNAAQKEIDRILTIYRAVVVYLNTPLMIEVAKSPMIKPPIMRTNVLKMNRNFKKSLELYEFVTAYDKDGYMINEENRVLSPFIGVVADELSEVVELSSFLTYEHGLGIREYFKERYEQEEIRRREEERKKFAEQIRNVSRHLKVSGMKPEEYILLLEKRIRDLEKEEAELEIAKKTIESLENDLGSLRVELETAQDTVRALGEEIVRLNKKYADDIAELHHKYTTQINTLILEHEQQIEEINRVHSEEIDALNAEHEEVVRVLKEEYENEIQTLKEEHAEEIEQLNGAHEEAMRVMKDSYEEEIFTMKNVHEEEVFALKTAHEEELARRQAEYDENIQSLTANYEAQIQELADAKKQSEQAYEATLAAERETYTSRIQALSEQYTKESQALNDKLNSSNAEVAKLQGQNTELSDKKAFVEARINALRAEHGLFTPDDDFTTKEKMDELEHQYKVFRKFFKTEWRKTKRLIRMEMYRAIFPKREKKTKTEAPVKATEKQETAVSAVSAESGEQKDLQTVADSAVTAPENTESAVLETVITAEIVDTEGLQDSVSAETKEMISEETIVADTPAESVPETETKAEETAVQESLTAEAKDEKDEDKA